MPVHNHVSNGLAWAWIIVHKRLRNILLALTDDVRKQRAYSKFV